MKTRREALDALNQALVGAEERLYAMNLGGAGCARLCDGAHLVWDRADGEWTLRVSVARGHDKDTESQLVLSAKVEHRILAANALPMLLQDIKERLGGAVTDIENATAAARSFGEP